MEFTQLKVGKDGHVGTITLNHPPNNSFSKTMVYEMHKAMDIHEADEDIRVILVMAEGRHFSRGADFDDITQEISEEGDDRDNFSVLGNRLVERIECSHCATVVAARGECWGGSSAVFSAFDIRIVGENFEIHDGDIYYATVGSWGMSSLRLPRWIGRNKMMDYMFLNECFTGRQAYELGIVSKVVPDDLVETVGMQVSKKIATAGPVAVRYFKECVRKTIYGDFEEAKKFEQEASEIVYATEDCKRGLLSLIEDGEKPTCEFYGR